MNKGFKIIKRIFIGIICMPIIIILLYIGYEIVGIAVNDYSADRQTKNLIDEIENTEDFEILDSYTFCGNTGNGNHVDMLSLVLVRAENSIDEVNIQSDGACEIISYECFQKYNYDSRFYDNLKFPENKENCYIIKLFNSAPFSDNILGH